MQPKSGKGVNRRGFIQIVAVAGAAAVCWKLGLFGPAGRLHAARRSVPIMGTVLNLTLYGPDPDGCEQALSATITTMQSLESRLSRHMADSELTTLNTTGRLENPSKDLLQVVTLAQDISRKTSGGFDITMLPLLQLHEEIRGSNGQADSGRLAQAKRAVGYQKLVLDGGGLRLLEPAMGVTLDGIGKGHIVDRGVDALRAAGFHNVYVEAGGDLMVTGRKDDKNPWRIGIRNPRPQQEQQLVSLAVSDKAVATSGDYLQAFTPDLHHHHIVDPHSGFSPPELASCTVTAPNAALADGLATALMVLGRDDGRDLIESLDGCEAYLVGKDLKVYTTTGFFS